MAFPSVTFSLVQIGANWRRDIGPVVIADPHLVLFSRTLEDTTAQQTVKIRNLGTRAVSFTGVTGNTEISVSPTSGTVAAEGELSLTFSYSPDSGSAALVEEEITLQCSEGATNHDVNVMVGASKISAALTTITHGSGGTLTVDTSDRIYQLTADCTQIEINHDVQNVEIDLNGFDVNYSTAHGILYHDHPTVGSGVGGCDHVKLYSSQTGSDVQQSGSTSDIHSINFDAGQSKFLEIDLTNIVLRPSQTDCNALKTYASTGNTPIGLLVKSDKAGADVISTVTTITNRHQLLGYMFRFFRADGNAHSYLTVDGVGLSGGCQGGIQFDTHIGAMVARCDISHTATYINGFGCNAGDDCVIIENTVDDQFGDQSGRGLATGGRRNIVALNTVDVIQDRDEAETPSGSPNRFVYAFQIESNDDAVVDDNIIIRNSFTATAISNYEAQTIRFTSLDSLCTGNIIANNDLTSARSGTPTADASLFGGAHDDHAQVHTLYIGGGTWTFDEHVLKGEWDGNRGMTFEGGDLTDGANNASTRYLAQGASGASNAGLAAHFVDMDFTNTTLDHDDISNISSTNSHDFDIQVGYSLDLTVDDGTNPISGATVTLDDNTSTEVDNETTDASGEAKVFGLYKRFQNDPGVTLLTETAYNNHTLEITQTGYDTHNSSRNFNQELTATVSLTSSTPLPGGNSMSTLSSNHIWLPLNGDAIDKGSNGDTFSVVGAVGDAWTHTPGWFKGNGNRAIWSEDSGVLSLIDFMNGAANGRGATGSILMLMFEMMNNPAAATSGTFLCAGNFSTSTAYGWGLLTNTTNNQVIASVNNLGAQGNRTLSSEFLGNDDQPHSVAMLLDMNNGEYDFILDGDRKFPTSINLRNFFGDCDDIDLVTQGIGLTLMCRNNRTTPGTPTIASGHQGLIRRFFMADLSDMPDPQRYFYRAHREFREMATTDPETLPPVIQRYF